MNSQDLKHYNNLLKEEEALAKKLELLHEDIERHCAQSFLRSIDTEIGGDVLYNSEGKHRRGKVDAIGLVPRGKYEVFPKHWKQTPDYMYLHILPYAANSKHRTNKRTVAVFKRNLL